MNKEEVLKKAQNKKCNKLDEMEVDILLRGNYVGLIMGVVLCLIIMVIKIYLDQPYQDIYSVVSSILCGQYLYKGFRLKDKFIIFIGAIWGISSLILLISYLM